VTLEGNAGGNPLLLNPNGGLIGGQGVVVPAAIEDLGISEQQHYQFLIGLPTREPFMFFVNVLGEPHTGSCAS
jgi:hypothetical protein